jgi:hypothetical protein
VISPASDPNPVGNVAPKAWVTTNPGTASGTYVGFTIHYVVPTVTPNGFQVSYAYHVIGS